MSDMHYIAKFAEKQLADAVARGMSAEQLDARIHAMKAEADALTPGGGYVVAYVAKNMDRIERSPSGDIEQGKPTDLQNAYLVTCITGYSAYHQNVVFAERLSGTLLAEIESNLRSVHGQPGSCFQLASIVPLGMVERTGFLDETELPRKRG
ncbi:hypothetical protein [Aeromonas salmonicida]|uniref:hypothetical protein n=1 Tax=Aeromonas salmonicida TaxID=645 RepID=UPI00244DA108|nr:hypothetical protein [Aeromonas salmonicida]WGI37822.1 hypothetical protein QDU35_15740 [Aeromonas salmonicida]HDN9511153.1 hypothetical protein [Aeromonas salmonicida]HDN9519338.1 hypothetical protein [Aeromonas salmonicida]